ncbi:helix-turn-helix transcriptional regulator [Pseudomonas yamanorum]|uniref:helix-turn-helix transcriptional regulator n=1 Tax=Pseudomonas yamanorum TaxID=515393 RepID=UPI003B9E0930
MSNENKVPANPRQLIRTKYVLTLLSIGRTTLFRLRRQDGTFPKPIKDSTARAAATYYVLSEIEAWIQKRMDDRTSSNQPMDNIQTDGNS